MAEDLPKSHGQSEGTSPEVPKEEKNILPSSGGRTSLRYLTRGLNDEDVKNPDSTTIAKILLGELDRADEECASLKGVKDDFHTKDKEAAVLKEKVDGLKIIDIIYSLGLCLGGALIGISPSIMQGPGAKLELGIATGVIGGLMILGSIIARAMVK